MRLQIAQSLRTAIWQYLSKIKMPSQDGGGIGRVITFSSTNSLKEQQNGEQSLQNNF